MKSDEQHETILLGGKPSKFSEIWTGHGEDFPLCTDGLNALGMVTAYWGLLEVGVDYHLANLASCLNRPMPAKLWKRTFASKLAFWRRFVIEHYPRDGGYKDAALKFIADAQRVQEQRNKIAHNGWHRAWKGKDRKVVTLLMSSGKRMDFTWEIDAAKLKEIAEEIARLHREISGLAPYLDLVTAGYVKPHKG